MKQSTVKFAMLYKCYHKFLAIMNKIYSTFLIPNDLKRTNTDDLMKQV